MAAYTTRYALYLAGGGSTGTITPDEPVDIDKINDNFKTIDTELGLPARLPSSVVNPRLGALSKSTVDGEIYFYYNGGWANALPQRLQIGDLDARYVSRGTDQLDGRYYTQSALQAGALDGRYFTKTDINNADLLNKTRGDSLYLPKASAHSQSVHDFKIVKGTWTAQTTSDPARGYSKTQRVNFGFTFPTVPEVVMTPHTQATAEQHFGVNAVDTSGFTAYYWRSDTTDCLFSWIAMGAG